MGAMHSTRLSGGEDTCDICLEPLEASDRMQQPFFGMCGHHTRFHQGCIQQWSHVNNQCPMCRSFIRDPDVFARVIRTERISEEVRQRDAAINECVANSNIDMVAGMPPLVATNFFIPLIAKLCTMQYFMGNDFSRTFHASVALIRAQYPPAVHEQMIREQERLLDNKKREASQALNRLAKYFKKVWRRLESSGQEPERVVDALNEVYALKRPNIAHILQELQDSTGFSRDVLAQMQVAWPTIRAQFSPS